MGIQKKYYIPAALLIFVFVLYQYKNYPFANDNKSNENLERISNLSLTDYEESFRIKDNDELNKNILFANYSESEETKLKPTTSRTSSHLTTNNDHRYNILKKLPRSVVLWTTWRSGSTFLGQMLNEAHKNTFYDYEPMLPKGVRIFRDDNARTREAVSYLNSVMRCDMNTHQLTSLRLSKKRPYLKHNTYMRDKCMESGIDCNDPSVLSSLCMNADFHTVKLLRLGLVWAHSLLSDPTLDTKIVFLVRDPRATMRSRMEVAWCGPRRKDCSDPAKVCHHILQDLWTAKELRAAYPNKFQFLRYEDLSLNVLGTVENLWTFLDFNLTNEEREKINDLTTDNGNSKSQYRVNRDSVEHTFSWRSSMEYKVMRYVQDSCTDVLNILGLRIFHNKEEYMNHSIKVFTKTAEDVAMWIG